MCLSVGRTPPLAQSAAAGRSAGIRFKPSVQRQPEDSSARRVRLLRLITRAVLLNCLCARNCSAVCTEPNTTSWFVCGRRSKNSINPNILFLSQLGTSETELQFVFELKTLLPCQRTGAKHGRMRAAVWVRTATHGTLKVSTAMLWSAGR